MTLSCYVAPSMCKFQQAARRLKQLLTHHLSIHIVHTLILSCVLRRAES